VVRYSEENQKQFLTNLFHCKCYRSSTIVNLNIGTGFVSTSVKSVKKKKVIPVRPVHIQVIFRKLAQFRN